MRISVEDMMGAVTRTVKCGSTQLALGIALAVLAPGSVLAGFVSMEEGARATGMGGAFTAIADDATAVFWNPAGHGLSWGFKLTGMRTRMFSASQISEDCLSLSYGRWHGVGFGFGWTRAGVEDVYHEDMFVLGAGRQLLLDGLSLGGSVRAYRIAAPGYEYYNDPNFRDSDAGYAGDVGLLYKGRNWSLGCTVRNLGEPELKLIETSEASDPISSEIRVAGTYTFREIMLLSGEVRRPREVPSYYDSKTSYYLGTEIWFFDVFALRSGLYRDRAAAGLGLKIENLTVDAAMLTERRPGNKYRLSVSLDF